MRSYIKELKVVLLILCIIIPIIMIRYTHKEKLAKIINTEENIKTIKLSAGSKIYEVKTENDLMENKTVTSIELKSNNSGIVKIDTMDKSNPDNVYKINTKMQENNMIIEFEKPKDNGNQYNYLIQKNDKCENKNFYSESGIKGYSYIIDNDENNVALNTINKLDESPILLQNINWNKDYYLHIKTFDNNNNCSENKTFKLYLTSNGINVKYIDVNSREEISCEEKISGYANDEYNVVNLEKDINNYKMIAINGETKGKLLKEKINIIYNYAKKANVIIRYLDVNGNQIAKNKTIESYEGQQIKVEPKIIENYAYLNNNMNYTYIVNEGENSISFIYEENKTENFKEKNKSDEYLDNEEVIDQKQDYNKTIKLKYIDYETNKLLYEEEIKTEGKSTIKSKLKRIEGYKVMNNDYDKSEKNIIDEIIDDIYIDTNTDKDAEKNNQNDNKDNEKSNFKNISLSSKKSSANAENIKEEYEIVMNCDDSDYIIYYKK